VVEHDLHSRFADWLSARVGATVEVAPFDTPGHGGFSNETLLTTATWNGEEHRLVLRVAPSGPGIFPSYDLGQQARIMDRLRAHTDVPVPEVLWREPDAAVLGREFYVMEHVEGRIPPDLPGYQFEGWIKDAPPDEQARVLDGALDAMARIHHVDPDDSHLEFLDRAEHGNEPIEQELGYWRAYLDWASHGEHLATHETILDWCVEQRPPEPTSRTLAWGDARLGNLIFGDDLSVRAVMDWEMAVIGPPELDLGWFLFLDGIALQFTDPLPGFPDHDGIVASYESRLGRRVEHLDWYEVWGGFRAACVQVPLGMGTENPLTAALLQRIG
jgi:aminoglycoside phosphotransferase (APT) family kinase protein